MIAYVLAVPLTVVAALAVAGTLLSDVPYVGLATAYVPWFVMWLIVAAAVGAVLAGYRWWRGRGWFDAALTVAAVLALAGASVITARMTAAVEAAGADIDLVDMFGIGSANSAPPDDEATYATFDGEPLRVSIYRPAGSTRTSRAPVLVYIHGGGWVAGDRHSRGTDLRWLADQGWLTISVEYPLSSDDRHLADVTQSRLGCALAWVAANAHNYGGDPARLSLSGHSAGGNLAINTAYLAAAGTLSSSCGGRIPAVHAVSVMYPAVDPAGMYHNPDPVTGSYARDMVTAYTGGSPEQFPERYQRILSASHITPAAPPTRIILPAADHLVPVAGTYRFAEQATAAGVDVDLVTVPYADHVFDARPGSLGQQAYRQLTARWLRDHGQGP
ncbi:alpha/beta hydrolase [Mycolicibacterium pulveris]|uniref:BD-FAE-like domain-containing protein n=1 Tax=Mycolicibacterium pulveris TaxID=36813 RepID=A0A7I7UMF3_MYCPV|nr:alpha/beta hydrolase [Mycolicibacterium pulveris]MCV6979934.1 alpha/beta hydrolase [Mycolicibacterium pulveris]BBY81306.1 hypothetical protein MPUL_24640 [Mycolicibacterium pulveris]